MNSNEPGSDQINLSLEGLPAQLVRTMAEQMGVDPDELAVALIGVGAAVLSKKKDQLTLANKIKAVMAGDASTISQGLANIEAALERLRGGVS